MGSSPTPCPSGSIQCIPEVRDGSARRASLHVLGMLLLAADLVSIELSIFFASLELISRSLCRSSSNRATFSAKISYWVETIEIRAYLTKDESAR